MRPHKALEVFALAAVVAHSAAKRVTIATDAARLDVDGNYIDAHDGKIVAHNGTYFLYGEAYGNQTLATPYPWSEWPRLKVYTSTDLVHWTFRGDPLPTVGGTLWIPNVIWHKPSQRFVMWYGSGGWGTATSTDGINFTPSGHKIFFSRFGAVAGTDGTGIFVDDDGTGYVAFASMPPGFDEPGHPTWPGHTAHGYGHIVSIEKLSADLLSSTTVNVTGLFPDDYVESPSLFKRKGTYYLTYGSCCCGCTEGGGQVVFTAKAVAGPWARQTSHADVNCRNASAPICGGFGSRSQQYKDLVYHAQWWGPSFIPLANGDTQVLFLGRRWLSGPNLPTGCFDICGNAPPLGNGNKAACQRGGEHYLMRSDNSVWYPVEFDADSGHIMPFETKESFELDLP
jgi:hypothetical protein